MHLSSKINNRLLSIKLVISKLCMFFSGHLSPLTPPLHTPRGPFYITFSVVAMPGERFPNICGQKIGDRYMNYTSSYIIIYFWETVVECRVSTKSG